MRLGLLAAFAFGLALAAPTFAFADEPPVSASSTGAISESLMAGLGQHAQRIEEMKTRGAFTFSGHVESVDGDGKASDVKEMVMRSTPTGTPRDRIVKVMRYVEDGKDKTAEAQAKADARREKHKEAKNAKAANDLKLPFLPSEQSRYTFSIVERDTQYPTRVKIAFNPKTPAEDAVKGTAWVDTQDREVLSTGFSLSKNPTFIDHIDVTIVFGLPSQLGRAPSKITFDGHGGFLFIHRRYRGFVTISDPGVTP